MLLKKKKMPTFQFWVAAASNTTWNVLLNAHIKMGSRVLGINWLADNISGGLGWPCILFDQAIFKNFIHLFYVFVFFSVCALCILGSSQSSPNIMVHLLKLSLSPKYCFPLYRKFLMQISCSYQIGMSKLWKIPHQ